MIVPVPLIVCADAHAAIGTGHVMRSLALAAAWQQAGGQATFLSHCPVAALRERIVATGAGLRSLDAPLADPRRLADEVAKVGNDAASPVLGATSGKTVILSAAKDLRRPHADEILRCDQNDRTLRATPIAPRIRKATHSPRPWVVLDGYHFDSACHAAIRRVGARLLVVDDLAHLPRYHADLVLNQNLGAEQMTYACDSDTRLLCGCRYALLRDEFRPWRGWQRSTPPLAHNVLVTLGGSDPQNVLPRLIEGAVRTEIPDLQIRVVIGAANAHAEEIRQAANDCRARLEFLTNVPDMAQQMAWADVAVSAAGTTCWELAFMQLPSLVTILVDNQRNSAQRLQEAGAAVNLGAADRLAADVVAEALTAICRDPTRRRQLAGQGRLLVDGEGLDRLLVAMEIEA
jgi:UDP-2,4-diacetamido-2,4,6-trideoxy-beta-L-altropyranose hydrolase